MIVWATTFSLLTLFLPKLHAFFLPEKVEDHHLVAKASDLSGRHRVTIAATRRRNNIIGIEAEEQESPVNDGEGSPAFHFDDNQSDLMDLNYMVNNSNHPYNNSRVKLSNISRKGRMQGVMMEVHEVILVALYNKL